MQIMELIFKIFLECKQQFARCVLEKEYHEGAASCAGFECPSGERCILRETYCVNPPCKLIRSCKSAEGHIKQKDN